METDGAPFSMTWSQLLLINSPGSDCAALGPGHYTKQVNEDSAYTLEFIKLLKVLYWPYKSGMCVQYILRMSKCSEFHRRLWKKHLSPPLFWHQTLLRDDGKQGSIGHQNKGSA